ncbi:MAG: LytTR family DNA-binding domain-containing protein [Gammaproteobacteria bacterium]|nr:LytTR family DNA-binding domain-containing protein [Gammaproteobacteria bacterium]
MKILIADDEKPARSRLNQLLKQSDTEIDQVSEAENGDQVLELCELVQPDVVLLDVRMPGKNGLQVCKQLSAYQIPPAVIIVSAYDEHALQAFDAHAIDYLLKPVHQQRLDAALRKAALYKSAQQIHTPDSVQQSVGRTHLSIKDRDTIYRIPLADILYFKAELKYVVIRTSALELLSNESLKNLQDEFNDQFIRVHRNALVACQHIASLEKDASGKCYIHFTATNDRVEISRRHLPKARQWIKINGKQGVA